MKRDDTLHISLILRGKNVFHGNWSCYSQLSSPSCLQALITLYFPCASIHFRLTFYYFFYTELKPQTLLSNCLPLKLLLSKCLFVLGFTCYVTKIISHIWVFGSLMRYTPNHTGAHQHSNARHSPDTVTHFLGAVCKKWQEFAGCSSITAYCCLRYGSCSVCRRYLWL